MRETVETDAIKHGGAVDRVAKMSAVEISDLRLQNSREVCTRCKS